MGLDDIQARIRSATAKAKRHSGVVELIGVSKRQPDERVKAILDQGHRCFGENMVQEAARKWPAFKASYPGVRLHLLGPLQTNKARQAMALFDYIHTLDRPKLAQTLARLADETGACPKLFIQVNIGSEPQKSGIDLAGLPDFVRTCQNLGLPVIGLMCLPPQDEEPSLHFALLAKLAERHELAELSIGMSTDFERAIAQGATYIRVGSAIFGARET